MTMLRVLAAASLPRNAVLGFLALALFPRAARSQPVADHPRVREAIAVLGRWLDAERAFKRIPGLSAAIVSDQEVIWQAGFGFADLARQTPATATTLYSICSISKLFTSIAAMQLRDAGKLRLDDPVAKHLPWFSLKNRNPADGEVTIEGLMTHASGLPREAAYPYWSAPSFEFPSRDQIKGALAGQEMLYRPERFFQYSNLGMTLLGEIVIAATGKTFDQAVRGQLLDPLGMRDTHTDMPAHERGRRLATGYGSWGRSGDRAALPFYQAQGIAPAAGFASTALDLARFASWQFRLLAKGGTELLSANTLREMQRVHFVDPDWETRWGLGFVVWRQENETLVGHDGACPGYRTALAMNPTHRLAAIVMTNAIDADASSLGERAHALMLPAIKAARSDSGPAKPPEPGLEPYFGGYQSSFGGEMHVVRWEGGLGTIWLPSDNPAKAVTKYRKIGEHAFRRIRGDGELAEELRFDVGSDGRAIRARSNYNVMPRIDP
ncbi:MAG: beta-lactamase family protein [Gemmatimonadetes bacterium]|nr:beta-lactamase family protein [Gemmatimonadota bacterium]